MISDLDGGREQVCGETGGGGMRRGGRERGRDAPPASLLQDHYKARPCLAKLNIVVSFRGKILHKVFFFEQLLASFIKAVQFYFPKLTVAILLIFLMI